MSPFSDDPTSILATQRYLDAVNGALDRLGAHGPEWGRGFAFHAPMAAEALARLGYYDEVPGWIEKNRRIRSYSDAPRPSRPLDPTDRPTLRAALGDFGRVADWAVLFDQQLAERPWREVLVSWWPMLLPGLSGVLGHGVIRTAHAVRSLSVVDTPSRGQLRELAQGLGHWAARYWESGPPGPRSPLAGAAAHRPAPAEARRDLIAATTTAAGIVADRAPIPTVPLIHAVTIPAAVDLVLPELPTYLHAESYRHAVSGAAMVLRSFGAHLRPGPIVPAGAPLPSLRDSVEAAVETGDEHAIKLAEVCVRSTAAHVDNKPYLRAVTTLIHRLAAGQATVVG